MPSKTRAVGVIKYVDLDDLLRRKKVANAAGQAWPLSVIQPAAPVAAPK